MAKRLSRVAMVRETGGVGVVDKSKLAVKACNDDAGLGKKGGNVSRRVHESGFCRDLSQGITTVMSIQRTTVNNF
jgi:hypothetical protein